MLKIKFNLPDVPEYINDDGSIPDETKIYYSKISIAIYWISGIGLFSWGIYLLAKSDVLGYFIVLVSIFSFYYANKKSSIKKAHIILNSKGIKTLNTSFMKWEDVVLIESRLNGSGKNSKWHLIVEFYKNDSDGNWGDDIEISDLNMSTKKIDQLIKLYQQRNKNNNIAIN